MIPFSNDFDHSCGRVASFWSRSIFVLVAPPLFRCNITSSTPGHSYLVLSETFIRCFFYPDGFERFRLLGFEFGSQHDNLSFHCFPLTLQTKLFASYLLLTQ